MGGHALRTSRPARWITGGGIAYAIGASFTRPFTAAADVLTGVVCVVGMAVLVARWRRPRGIEAPAVAEDATRGRSCRSTSGVWWAVPIGLTVAVIAWELTTYAGSPRSAHPTLSSLIDLVDGSRPGKSVAFMVWLALGWFVLR
jgi:hypothetical protein